MFNVAWSELFVILIVAIGILKPSDLAIVAKCIKKIFKKITDIKREFNSVLNEVADTAKPQKDNDFVMPRIIIDMEGKPQISYDVPLKIDKKSNTDSK